jgi:hypothetical protein
MTDVPTLTKDTPGRNRQACVGAPLAVGLRKTMGSLIS